MIFLNIKRGLLKLSFNNTQDIQKKLFVNNYFYMEALLIHEGVVKLPDDDMEIKDVYTDDIITIENTFRLRRWQNG